MEQHGPVSTSYYLAPTVGFLNSFSNVVLQILQAIQVAEKQEKPPVKDIFTDVYDIPPANLQEQEVSIRETIKRHPQDYPTDVPL